MIAGKKASLLGGLDVPHSLSYMPDVVSTLITIANDERALGKATSLEEGAAATVAWWRQRSHFGA